MRGDREREGGVSQSDSKRQRRGGREGVDESYKSDLSCREMNLWRMSERGGIQAGKYPMVRCQHCGSIKEFYEKDDFPIFVAASFFIVFMLHDRCLRLSQVWLCGI